MENKTANWTELGVRPYDEVMRMQNTLVKLRASDAIGDTILSVQHPISINFGASQRDNQFSELLLGRVRKRYGNIEPDSVVKYLADEGISFHYSDRGGGATAFAPGQYVFYPIVKHGAITGKPSIDIGAYKSRIYLVLFDSLNNLGVNGIQVSDHQQFRDRNERRDAWIVRDGVTLKMGSKGIKISGDVAYHGFALYVDRDCILPNNMVNQCGYAPDEVKLWTVEHELGQPVSPSSVYDSVKSAMSRHFGYSGFVELTHLPTQEVVV